MCVCALVVHGTAARAQSDDCREAVLAAYFAFQIAIPAHAKRLVGQALTGQERRFVAEAERREQEEPRICGDLPPRTRRRILIDFGALE